MPRTLMDAAEVRAFLTGKRVYALDPATCKVVAYVDYGTDGTCSAKFFDGETDVGVYGFEGATYWTRYRSFRQGARHVFRLEWRGPDAAQAYFVDGTIAFLQSHVEKPAAAADT